MKKEAWINRVESFVESSNFSGWGFAFRELGIPSSFPEGEEKEKLNSAIIRSKAHLKGWMDELIPKLDYFNMSMAQLQGQSKSIREKFKRLLTAKGRTKAIETLKNAWLAVEVQNQMYLALYLAADHASTYLRKQGLAEAKLKELYEKYFKEINVMQTVATMDKKVGTHVVEYLEIRKKIGDLE